MSIASFPRFERYNQGKTRDRRKFGKRTLAATEITVDNSESPMITPSQVQELFVSILQAEIQLKSVDDSRESEAHKHFMETVGAADVLIGSYAEYVMDAGVSSFDAKGRNGTIPDPVTHEPGIFTPHSIYELDDAIKIYEHTRSENSQALVEALLYRYSSPVWQKLLPQRKKHYNNLQLNLNEQSETTLSKSN